MNEREKQALKTLVNALNILPDNKREFLLGYAEGVAAMAERQSLPLIHSENVSAPCSTS